MKNRWSRGSLQGGMYRGSVRKASYKLVAVRPQGSVYSNGKYQGPSPLSRLTVAAGVCKVKEKSK